MKPAAYILAAVTVLALAHLGLPKTLGAHPFWATQIGWIGVPIGLIAALALRRIAKPKRVVLFTLLLATTASAAHFGKMQFAASFAEDKLAGQFWYFGWIGVAAMATALIAALLSRKT